jgi:predicted amidohydrolase
MTLRVALCQTEGRFADKQGAIRLLAAEAQAARDDGADVLVFPELFLTGYNLGADRAAALAEPADGPSVLAAREIARAAGLALCFGFPERVGDGVANAAVLIAADGDIVLRYRKAHLFGEIDRAMFATTGQAFPIVPYGGIKLGLAICYDIEFPETIRLLALAGAEAVLVPTALMEPYEIVPRAVIPSRAYESQVYVAYANHCGEEAGLRYVGLSCIAGPDGAVLAMAGQGPARISAVIDPAHLAAVRARDTLLDDRRPELYGPLAG